MNQSELLEKNKAIVLQFFAHLEAGNIDGVTGLFAKDGTFWAPSTRKTMGCDEFAQSLHWVKGRLSTPLHFQIQAMTAEDNRVSVLAESFATTVDGESYNNLYHFYFELKDGRITAGREYNDTRHVWATLRKVS